MNKLLFCLGFLCLAAAAQEIWQLGIPDGSGREFLPYSNGEFQTSPGLRDSPAYDREAKCFTYRIPGPGVAASPRMPAGISGDGSGNYAIVRAQKLVWREREPGFRELELKIVVPAGGKDFARLRLTPSENMDIDGMTWAPGELRIALPGNRVVRRVLPADIGAHGPITVKAVFPVSAGENTIELAETSGDTYGRLFHFDYIKLAAVDSDRRPEPAAEFRNPVNFLNNAVFEAGTDARLGVDFFNLPPNAQIGGQITFLDYFGNETKIPVSLISDSEGYFHAEAAVPGKSGHFRVRAEAPGSAPAETRIAGIRTIAPLTDGELDYNFLGLCGLSYGSYFPPEAAPETRLAALAEYRAWRRLLQVKQERIHSLMWNLAEPEEGRYRWEMWDALIKEEKADGIRVQLGLLGTPKWLFDRHFPNAGYTHPKEYVFAPPPDMEKWRNFCELAARRYGDFVGGFEIWNEVSGQSMFWQKGTAVQFVELARNGAEAIRKAAPGKKIVIQTLWPRQEEFIRKIFELGIARYADIHADHYLSDDRVRAAKEIIGRYAPDAPFISNEDQSGRTGNNPLGEVDEPARRYAASRLIRDVLFANAHGFQRIYHFMLTGRTWRTWGLVGPDRTPKYTFSVYKTLFNRTAGAKFQSYEKLSHNLERFVYRYDSPERIAANGGEYLVVLCNSGKKTEELFLPALGTRCRLIDLMDNETEAEAPNRNISVTVGPSPVMLTGIDVEALKKLSAFTITPGKQSLRPGEPLTLQVRADSEAELSIATEGFSEEFQLKAGEKRPVAIPARRVNEIRSVKIAGRLRDGERILPVTRYFDFVVEDQEPGLSLLPPFSKESWIRWGKAEAEFIDGRARVTVNAPEHSGAIRVASPVKVVPNARYLLDFQAKGSGTLRVMLNGIDAEGRSRVLNHNLLAGQLGEQPASFRKEFQCPPDVREILIHFYEYKSVGRFEIGGHRLIRLTGDRPVNRQLYRIAAEPGAAPAAPVGIGGGARFGVSCDGGKLYFKIEAPDRIFGEGSTPKTLWEGDSVQLDFDLSDGSRKVRTVQFGFALQRSKPVSYRFSTLPASDLVDGYRVGENPAGVETRIERNGDQTTYHIAIPAEAIHPQLKLISGMTLGFSLLVNNNDGNGRTGYLEWSSGIGRHQDSTLFGALEIP